MLAARLEIALRDGLIGPPPAGQNLPDIAVYLPKKTDNLSALPRVRLHIVTPFKHDFDHFAQLGFAVSPSSDTAPQTPLAIVCLPRAKAAARDILARAAQLLAPQGRLILDGQKTDGIGAILAELTELGADTGEVISKAHGKMAAFAPPAGIAQWRAQPQVVAGDFTTFAGIFSADGPDRASTLLANLLPASLPAYVADFGAGWGYLSRAILARKGVQHLDVIEADADALACAKINLTDPRAQFHWADVTQFRPAHLWDCVVMNPPFHTARSPDAGLGLGFIAAAHAKLAPSGKLWLVANRQLPYLAPLRALFREVEEFGNDASFRLVCAAYPKRG